VRGRLLAERQSGNPVRKAHSSPRAPLVGPSFTRKNVLFTGSDIRYLRKREHASPNPLADVARLETHSRLVKWLCWLRFREIGLLRLRIPREACVSTQQDGHHLP